MHAAHGKGHALGKAPDARGARTLRRAPGLARRALAATVRRLAGDPASEQALADPAAHLVHHARILVAQHEWRRPREEALGRVEVRPADARGVYRHDDLPGSRRWVGSVVDGEACVSAPGGNLHGILRIPSSTRAIGS